MTGEKHVSRTSKDFIALSETTNQRLFDLLRIVSAKLKVINKIAHANTTCPMQQNQNIKLQLHIQSMRNKLKTVRKHLRKKRVRNTEFNNLMSSFEQLQTLVEQKIQLNDHLHDHSNSAPANDNANPCIWNSNSNTLFQPTSNQHNSTSSTAIATTTQQTNDVLDDFCTYWDEKNSCTDNKSINKNGVRP